MAASVALRKDLFLLAMVVSCVGWSVLAMEGPWSIGLALATVGGSLLSFRTLHRRQSAIREAAWLRDAATMDEFGRRDGWLVDLMVRRGEAPTGSDRGMLWIEDGRLYFAGRRTSFGLSADQAAGFCRQGLSIPGLRHELDLRLVAPGPLSITFEPVSGAKWQKSRRTAHELREAINRWAGQGGVEGGQLPPLAIGPGAPSANALLLRALAPLLYWPATLLAFASPFPFPIVLAALATACFLPSVWVPTARLRAWHDRRRLS